MRCLRCGTEFHEGRFCPRCGLQVVQPNNSAHNGIYNKIWNHPMFNKAAIVFNHFDDWVTMLASIIWIKEMIELDSMVGTIIGVVVFFGCLFSIIQRFSKKRKLRMNNNICPFCNAQTRGLNFCANCGSMLPKIAAEQLDDSSDNTPRALNKKKRDLLISCGIWLVIIVILINGGFYSFFKMPIVELKRVALGDYDKTIGEMIEDSFENEKWTCEKTDKDTYRVYVRGYMSSLDEYVEIKFFFQLHGEYFEYGVRHVKLYGSDKKYTDTYNLVSFFDKLEDE